jgi:branched-chain amino acid transport system substrate-binding protein
MLVLCSVLRAEGETPPAASPIKVGVVLCLTGACKQTGVHALNGLMLARDEINSKGGIRNRPVELVVEDSREVESPSHAVSAYRRLRLDPEISLFVATSWSIGGLAVAPIAVRDPIVMISPSIGIETFNETGPNLFSLWPHDSVSTKALARYAIEKGWKRVAVISNTSTWQSRVAEVFRNEYKQLGGHETDFFEIASSDNNVRPLITKIKHSKPDFLFLTNYSQLGLTGRIASEVQLNVPKMTILLEDHQIDLAKGSLEGLIFAMYDDSSADFVKRYQTKYKVSPDLSADTGYDTLYIFKDAIERAQSFDPKRIQETLLTTDVRGASGRIQFDGEGGVVKTPLFKGLRRI